MNAKAVIDSKLLAESVRPTSQPATFGQRNILQLNGIFTNGCRQAVIKDTPLLKVRENQLGYFERAEMLLRNQLSTGPITIPNRSAVRIASETGS